MEEPHAVVRLLVERIASNPEEFKRGTARWVSITNQVEDWGSETDKQAINDALREVRLTQAHEEMMDELLNGEDRRREVETEEQHAAARAQQKLHTTAQITPFRFPLGGLT